MAERDAVDVGPLLRPEPQGDDARRVGLQGEVDQVEPLPRAFQELAGR